MFDDSSRTRTGSAQGGRIRRNALQEKRARLAVPRAAFLNTF